MAYNYNPYMGGYYPQYNTYQQYQQPTSQQIQRPQQVQPQYETPIQDIRFVTSEEAKAYIVMPNSKALLIDKQNNTAFLKTADNMGQSSNKIYKFNEVNEDGEPVLTQKQQEIDTKSFIKREELKDYITFDDLNRLNEEIDKLNMKVDKALRLKELIGGKEDAK